MGKATEDPNAMAWTVWGEKVIVTPVPTVINQLNFWCWIQGAQAGAGVLNLPIPYHHLVPLYMAYKGHEAKQNTNLAKAMYDEYNSELQRIVATIHSKDNPTLNFIKPGVVGQATGS
jgi:hypothetical protein